MAPSRKSSATKPKLNNHQIVVLATYMAGGEGAYVDTEDIAIRANELAPGRFSWRKYKQQINIETVRKRLWDATKPEKGGHLIGSERDGWLITPSGVKFCKKHLKAFANGPVPINRTSKREGSWILKEKARLLAEPAFQKLQEGHANQITPIEAERFFRVDDYVVGEARKRKLQRTIEAFRSDAELSSAISKIAKIVRER